MCEMIDPANDNSDLVALSGGHQTRCVKTMPVRVQSGTPGVLRCGASSSGTGMIRITGNGFSVVTGGCVICIIVHTKTGVSEILVYAVSDILTISGDNIFPAPQILAESQKYMRGIHATDRRMVCIVEPVGLCPDTESEAA